MLNKIIYHVWKKSYYLTALVDQIRGCLIMVTFSLMCGVRQEIDTSNTIRFVKILVLPTPGEKWAFLRRSSTNWVIHVIGFKNHMVHGVSFRKRLNRIKGDETIRKKKFWLWWDSNLGTLVWNSGAIIRTFLLPTPELLILPVPTHVYMVRFNCSYCAC